MLLWPFAGIIIIILFFCFGLSYKLSRNSYKKMEDLVIREVTASDNMPLAKLIREVFDEHEAPHQCTVYSDPTTDDLYALFQKPRSVLWVAVLHNKILGCCGIYPTEGLPGDCAELAKFYLLKEGRGKGIGKQLMQLSFQSAKEMGYKKLYLE